MPQWKLHHVRTDDKHVVFTEYPDLIHPRELSAWLQGQYGRPNIHIYLVKDIYVIYIKRDAVNEDGEVVGEINMNISESLSHDTTDAASDYRLYGHTSHVRGKHYSRLAASTVRYRGGARDFGKIQVG